MIRLLIFLLAVVFFAAAATLLFSLGDVVRVEAFGWKLDAPSGIAGAFIALFAGAIAVIVSIVKDVTAIRRRSALRQIIKRRNKGVDALVEAATAQGEGHAARAQKLAQKASRLLDRNDVAALFAPAPAINAAPEPGISADEPEPETPLPAPLVPSPERVLAPATPDPAPLPHSPTEITPEIPNVTIAAREAEETLDRDAAAARRVS